jgi:hypothetical protein
MALRDTKNDVHVSIVEELDEDIVFNEEDGQPTHPVTLSMAVTKGGKSVSLETMIQIARFALFLKVREDGAKGTITFYDDLHHAYEVVEEEKVSRRRSK